MPQRINREGMLEATRPKKGNAATKIKKIKPAIINIYLTSVSILDL
jgi:hypothetical protein